MILNTTSDPNEPTSLPENKDGVKNVNVFFSFTYCERQYAIEPVLLLSRITEIFSGAIKNKSPPNPLITPNSFFRIPF